MGYTPLSSSQAVLYDYNLNRMLRELYDMNQSLFNEQTVVERTPVITLNSGFGVSALRDITALTGSGAITLSSGELLLSTGATATSSAKLESAVVGTYIPGSGAQLGVGMRLPTAPSGNQFAKWGGLNNSGTDGFYWGVDATGFYVARLDRGVETKVRSDDFNGDKLDGTGNSAVTVDLANGYIFQIDYTYYGHGPIVFSTARYLNGTNTWITAHVFDVDAQVSIEDPNLAIYAEVNNGGDATDLDAYVGGRQYSIVGKYIPNRRVTGQARTSVSTTTTAKPLITFRRKSGFGNRGVNFSAFKVTVGAEPVVVEVRLDGTLTGASYVNPTNHVAAETALETDISATAITGGQVVWSEYFAAGNGANTITDKATLGLGIPRNQPVTLCARTVTGTGTVIASARMEEEW